MAHDCSKNTGKILFSIFCFIILILSEASAAQVRTKLQSSRVSVGERTVLQITITGVSEAQPRSIPKVPGLQISFQGTQHFSSVNMTNWKVQRESGLHLLFSVTPRRTGTFRIPKIIIISGRINLSSQPVSLIAGRSSSTADSGGPLRLLSEVTLKQKIVYIGEPIILRYAVLHSGIELADKPQFEKMPDSKGFVQKVIDEPVQDNLVTKDDIQYTKSHVETFLLIPTQPGKFTIGGGIIHVSYIVADHFPFPRKTRLQYEPVSLTVKPLPSTGKPDDFHGNVGVFSMKSTIDNTPVMIFEEKRLIISIKGYGNLSSLSKPKLANKIKNIKIISEESGEKLAIENGNLSGEKTYSYTLIPERSGTINIGNFVFNFFNIKSGQYETLKTGEIVLEVTGNLQSQSQIKLQEKGANTFSDVNIIIIIIIIAAVAGLVGAVIIWERKRLRVASGADTADTSAKDVKSNKMVETGYYREMLTALRQKDSDLFMKASENILRNRVNGSDSNKSNNAEKIKGIKDRLYNYKYGGEQITEVDMENIYQEIKNILD